MEIQWIKTTLMTNARFHGNFENLRQNETVITYAVIITHMN